MKHVRDVLSAAGPALGLDERLGAVMRAIADAPSRHVAVVDADQRFMGLVSDLDVLRAAVPDPGAASGAGASHAAVAASFDAGAALADVTAAQVVSKGLTVAPGDPLIAAAAAMLEGSARCVAVVDGGRLVGLVSCADLCAALARAPGSAP